jgi:hypothetical protein
MAVDPGTPAPQEPSLKPTRKWWVTQVTALAALAVMYLTTGGWDNEESVALVGIISQAVIGWLVPNEATVPRTGVLAKGE